jgi:hypothetical protein
MKRGRRTKLTPTLQRQLCKIIAMPCTIRTACESCSVSETAFFAWVRRGEKGEKPYAQFVQRLMRARGQGKTKILRSIWDSGDVRVKLEALARIYPDEFGRVDVRPLPQPEPEKKITVAFVCDTKGKTLAEVANFPIITTEQAMPESERGPTAGELFDGNISRLGSVEHDLPYGGNCG